MSLNSRNHASTWPSDSECKVCCVLGGCWAGSSPQSITLHHKRSNACLKAKLVQGDQPFQERDIISVLSNSKIIVRVRHVLLQAQPPWRTNSATRSCCAECERTYVFPVFPQPRSQCTALHGEAVNIVSPAIAWQVEGNRYCQPWECGHTAQPSRGLQQRWLTLAGCETHSLPPWELGKDFGTRELQICRPLVPEWGRESKKKLQLHEARNTVEEDLAKPSKFVCCLSLCLFWWRGSWPVSLSCRKFAY